MTTVSAPPPSATVYERLRKLILDGAIPPGAVVPQLHLARDFGVSRTPLREALRRLQEEGLVDVERHRRPRVAEFDLGELQAIYASRIMLEALGVSTTVPLLTPVELDELDEAIVDMGSPASLEDLESWELAHRRFHDLLVCHSGPLVETIAGLADRGYRYRRMFYMRIDEPQRWVRGQSDHQEIADACRSGDRSEAGRLLARHLARTVIGILTEVAPETDPVIIRGALRLVLATDEPA